MPHQMIVSSLLGRDKSAIETYIKATPVKIIRLDNGWVMYLFDESSKIREVHVDPDGRIARCGFAKELRQAPRVTASHYISVMVNGCEQGDLQGMLLDMSKKSLRIRLKHKPYFLTGTHVTVDFCFKEGGESHHMNMMATVLRSSITETAYDLVVLFDPPDDKEHPFIKFIRCRECEIVHGQKYCVQLGRKCKADLSVNYPPGSKKLFN